MMRTKHIAAIVGLALVASAGIAAATYAGKSIWGGNNPGQGGLHAAMPDAAAENNKAGANHPFPDNNGTGGEGGSCGGNETAEGTQPDDGPPAHAKDGEPEDGKPADVPPLHSCADENAHTGE